MRLTTYSKSLNTFCEKKKWLALTMIFRCRQMSLPKRRVALAYFVGILVCAGAIAATVILVKNRNATSESPEFRGGTTGNPNETTDSSDIVMGVEAKGENEPTMAPSAADTGALPAASPTSQRLNPKDSWKETVFYVIADVPYNDNERRDMPGLVGAIPEDAQFAIHLGDIKHADEACNQAAIDTFVGFIKESAAPMFVVVGDNEYNDCSNPEEALGLWRNELVRFDSKHWNHSLPVQTMADRSESFFFVNKGTLFIGLNLVGTPSFSDSEWNARLETQLDWTVQLIEDHRTGDNEVGAVVIFGHASPNAKHDVFFRPLRSYVRDVLQNALPLLYLCGDVHSYLYEESYEDQPSWLRVRLEGGSNDPPLKIVVNPPKISGGYSEISEVFGVTRFWQ